MAYPHQHRSQFGDTTLTKVFVGGLAGETPTHEMRRYFEQFGDILDAVIITNKNTTKSKGYGFVTFGDPESARRACAVPNPMIDGRRANCNIASLGRPRPSPPRARTQSGNLYESPGGPLLPPPPANMPAPFPPPPPMVYPHYGYPTYPSDYGHHQALYNPQYYGASSSLSPSSMGSPYFYGYSLQTSPRGSFSTLPRTQRPSYVYYPSQIPEGSFFPYRPQSSTRNIPNYQPPSTDLQTTSAETEVTESPNT